MQSEHTDTPWFAHIDMTLSPQVDDAGSIWGPGTTPEGSKLIAVTTKSPGIVEARANTEFIVQACNAHQPLIEAATELLHQINICKFIDNESGVDHELRNNSAVHKLIQAISDAGISKPAEPLTSTTFKLSEDMTLRIRPGYGGQIEVVHAQKERTFVGVLAGRKVIRDLRKSLESIR